MSLSGSEDEVDVGLRTEGQRSGSERRAKMDRKGKVSETQEARGGVQGQSKVEKRKKKKKKDGGEGGTKSIRSPSRAPARAGTRGAGWETGQQEPRSLDKGLGQQRSGRGQSLGTQCSSRPAGRAHKAPPLGWGLPVRASVPGWVGGSGASSSCTPTWLSQGLFSHLDPAHCPMLGSACSGFGPGSCTQKLASDLQTFTLSARALVSTITHPTAWSRKPTTYSQAHCHCPVVSLVPPLPLWHLCSHQTVPASRAQFPPPQEPAQSTAAWRNSAQTMIWAAPLALRLPVSASHLICANVLPLN